jgi:hypothetical protein
MPQYVVRPSARRMSGTDVENKTGKDVFGGVVHNITKFTVIYDLMEDRLYCGSIWLKIQIGF